MHQRHIFSNVWLCMVCLPGLQMHRCRYQIHIWFIFICEGGLNLVCQYLISCTFFPCSHVHITDLVCATWEEQTRTGSLDPCGVNPGCVDKNNTSDHVCFLVNLWGLHSDLKSTQSQGKYSCIRLFTRTSRRPVVLPSFPPLEPSQPS